MLAELKKKFEVIYRRTYVPGTGAMLSNVASLKEAMLSNVAS